MPSLIYCPSCNGPLRIPDDSDASTFTCPRCMAEVPRPDPPDRDRRDDIAARDDRLARRRAADRDDRPRSRAYPDEDDDPRDVRRPGADGGVVGVVLASVLLVLAFGGVLYLWTGMGGLSMTERKHIGGILTMGGILLIAGVAVAGVYVARGRDPGTRIAGIVLTILSGLVVFLLISVASVVFMVSTCLEPCDSKSRQQQQQKPPPVVPQKQ